MLSSKLFDVTIIRGIIVVVPQDQQSCPELEGTVKLELGTVSATRSRYYRHKINPALQKSMLVARMYDLQRTRSVIVVIIPGYGYSRRRCSESSPL